LVDWISVADQGAAALVVAYGDGSQPLAAKGHKKTAPGGAVARPS